MTESKIIDQNQLTTYVCARPQNFAWFLGAGASRAAGMPSATDILWEMKRRYYCQEENQDIARQDVQSEVIRARIQAFMESRGFPEEWSEDEYPVYFEKIFGDDKERQRKYIRSVLSEDKVTLVVGNRVMGALIASELCRVAFTTNFDSVVERAVSEVSGKAIAAYHLEGAHAAKHALDNEEYPIYCKLHGDFRYDSLKNLPGDLAKQNDDLAECFVNAGNRFGMVVTGYSGRDKSIMALFHSVLSSSNPFPHGLFWTHIKGTELPEAVTELLEAARQKGVNAQSIAIETFDALLLRIWRNLENKPAGLDAKVRKTQSASVSIPLPDAGSGKPLLRLNALPIISLPQTCLELTFSTPKSWDDLRKAQHDNKNAAIIFTKAEAVWCWGNEEKVKEIFGAELTSVQSRPVPSDINAPENLHVHGFLEQALCQALARGRPLLTRTMRTASLLIVDPHAQDVGALNPLFKLVGKPSGIVPGLFAPIDEDHPHAQQVTWAESVRLSIDSKDGRLWLQLDPDVWVWPPRARKSAVGFLDKRRGDRYNKKYNELLDAWIQIIFGGAERNSEVVVSCFDEGSESANPAFRIGNRTAFARRLVA